MSYCAASCCEPCCRLNLQVFRIDNDIEEYIGRLKHPWNIWGCWQEKFQIFDRNDRLTYTITCNLCQPSRMQCIFCCTDPNCCPSPEMYVTDFQIYDHDNRTYGGLIRKDRS